MLSYEAKISTCILLVYRFFQVGMPGADERDEWMPRDKVDELDASGPRENGWILGTP